MSNPALLLDQYRIREEPYYRPLKDEVELFGAAYASRMPVMLKGPTGCGKTRFIEYMAWRLDGPLTTAVRLGAICYLDEIVEARQDTTVVIHPLTDDRRVLPLEKRGELIHAHSDFQLVISYNPGYQSAIKDLKESTKQRFAALDFGYPDRSAETEVVSREAGIEPNLADLLVRIAQHSRNLKGQGLDEGASTRMLVNAGRLIGCGISLEKACETTIVVPLTDDADTRNTLRDVISASA